MAPRKSKFPPIQRHWNRVRRKQNSNLTPSVLSRAQIHALSKTASLLRSHDHTHTLNRRHFWRPSTLFGQELLFLDKFHSSWLPLTPAYRCRRVSELELMRKTRVRMISHRASKIYPLQLSQVNPKPAWWAFGR